MSDLSATNCGCGNTCQNGGLFGGNSCCLILILLLCCGNNGLGANNGCGCNDGCNNGCNSLIWLAAATAAAESARITAADAIMAVDADSIGI